MSLPSHPRRAAGAGRGSRLWRQEGLISLPLRFAPAGNDDPTGRRKPPQYWRATIIFLISAIAFAGLRPFGQAFEQFMIVWQR